MGGRTVDEAGKITIEESEMVFGAFPNNHFDAFFDIEKSKIYQNIEGYGVSSAEFLLRKTGQDKEGKNCIWIVEAKASSPKKLRCINQKADLVKYIENEDKEYQSRNKSDFLIELWAKVKYDSYFADIKSKFNDVLALIASISLTQHPCNAELPKSFHFSSENKFYLILIVKNEKKNDDMWLQDLQSLTEIKLKSLVKLWNLPETSIKVMDEKRAIKRGLINKL